MNDDTSFDWNKATPEDMRDWSVRRLYRCMELGGNIYEPRARAELTRRQNEALQILVANLTISTDKVHTEVSILSSSSDRLERLTVALKNLTIVLTALTVLAVFVPIGIEVWKAYHESQSEPVSAPTKQEP